MRALAVVAVILLSGTAAVADDCEMPTSTPAVDAAGAYYVAIDCTPFVNGCIHTGFPVVWVYEESNGLPGLQREDPFVNDACGPGEGDTVVF